MRFKFITLNLWRGGVLFDEIIAFIKKENPDILALQEVYNGKDEKLGKQSRTIEIFKSQFFYKYFYFSPAFLDERKRDKLPNGNAIFSRYPIIANKTIFYDIPFSSVKIPDLDNFSSVPRNLQHVVIQIDNFNFNVYNTQGIWGFDGNDNQRRLKMSQTIVNEIKNKDHIILAGDFNILPQTQSIKNIEKYLNNVFTNELKTTFNMNRKDKGDYATSVVDMIFVSKDIKILDHYCPSVDISDHLPLVAILEVNAKLI